MAQTFVTLLGSLRKASFNGGIARALPALAPEGVDDRRRSARWAIFLSTTPMCRRKGFPPAVTAMGEAIRAADGVIIVSPEYNYSIPGGLKNAIDWLSRLPEQPFKAKPILIQSASPGALGGARMQYQLRQCFVFLDARVFNAPEVMVGGAMAKFDKDTGDLTDQGTKDFIGKQLAAFAAFARA